ncbi:glycosyltransferase family 4 protein [Kaistia terrae]|nr:glycosyltransferase family 4 protein [Kaistia terrae]MCX5576723.1 glycosyltransferase family 4 protein [Kaistia terrae]
MNKSRSSESIDSDLRPSGIRRVAILASSPQSLITFRGNLISALSTRGLDVIATAPLMDNKVIDGLSFLGARAIGLNLSRTGFNPFADLQALMQYRQMFLDNEVDVVIPYTIKPVIWGTLAARRTGVIRVVPMITGLGYPFSNGYEPRRLIARFFACVLYRLAFSRANVVLFQNPDDMALFRKWRILPGKMPAAVINGSGVDLVEFSPVPMPIRPGFLMIARLLRDKGVHELAAAAKLLKAQYPDIAVRLVGSLDESPNGIRQSELEDITGCGVEYLGRLDDVRPAIAENSVYVLPSYYREGTPRSTLEAMAMGRAVVTTDAPGCRETVVEGVNGFLVPPRDAVALAAAMEKFIRDPGLAARMGSESRRIAEEKYDVNLVNAEIMRHAGL